MAKKILRWLLSNLLVILVIISVIYSYIYWGNLSGGNTPAGKAVAFLSQKFDGVNEFVEGVKSKQARLAGVPSGQQSTTESVADMPETDMQETEMPVTASSTSFQESLPQENTQLDVAAEETAIEKQGAVELKSIAENNVVTNESEASKTIGESSASNQSDLESSGKAGSDVVAAKEDESTQVGTEQTETSSLLQVETEQQPASISYSQNNTQVKQTSDGEIESFIQAQSAPAKTEGLLTPKLAVDEQLKPESDIAKDGFIPAEVTAQVESVKEDGAASENVSVEQVPSTAQSLAAQSPAKKTEMSIQDTWILARSAFYQKNYALSEQSYQSVIAATKDNFDAYGELGNVYFSQGKKSQAADAYLRAATILFTRGHHQRAQSLLRTLQQLDISKANQLQHLMDVPSL